LRVLDECGDVERIDSREFSDAVGLAPLRESARSIHLRLAHVVVFHLGAEEFEHALGGLGRRREERR
jgi:hypothetical protein